MYIDTDVQSGRQRIWLQLLFVAVIFVMIAALLSWWQSLIVVVLGILATLWQITQPTLSALSVKDPKELWQLGMGDELWQAYLDDIICLDLGIVCVLQLRFYVTEPMQKHHWLFISCHDVDEATFCQLRALVNVGGYH